MYLITIVGILTLLHRISEVSTDVVTCGKTTSDNLNGNGLPSGIDVPWNAPISRRDEILKDKTYAGILVSPSLVLTPGHHLLAEDTGRFRILPFHQYFATSGTRNFGDPAHTDREAFTTQISHIRIHPHFTPIKRTRWPEVNNDFSLHHLTQPVPLSDKVTPICLPDSEDEKFINQLQQSSTNEDLVLTGWNEFILENMFLRLKIQDQKTCQGLWQQQNDTIPYPYVNRWCAQVGSENNHSICIHRDVGGIRLVNGSYFLSGIVNNFFSTNQSRICYPGAVSYFLNITPQTFRWIEDNIRCGAHNFTCSNGDCVPLSGLCDQIPNCSDGSDEEPKFCRGLKFCTEDEFPCGDYGKCIPKDEVGDGVIDCELGEDEIDNGGKKVRSNANVVTVLGVGISAAVLFTLVLFVAFMWYRHNAAVKEVVKDFLEGISPNAQNVYVGDPMHCLPYKAEDEIPLEDLEILEEINRGNFGIVRKVRLLKPRGKFPAGTIAAVKVPLRQGYFRNALPSIGVKEFKALLCELKIQSCVGYNQHIVTFLGASTTNLRRGDLYMVVEYCENGSLKDYLVANAQYFVDLPHRQNQSGSQINNTITTINLLVWSVQIACGMAFLASKNVVHRDLALRNVLLSLALDAKISDFGLSREFGQTGLYAKRTPERVPWRWLPIEALRRDSVFSEKSDVWAYGVTLWEIYSLGETPHRTARYDRKFRCDLETGVRLTQPMHASNKVYRLMKHCWEQKQVDRPTFTALRFSLASILQKLNYPTEGICDHLHESPEYFDVLE